MNDNQLLAIKKKDDAPGYVYLVRFNHAKDCYKIGSTGNLFKRMKTYGDKWHDVDLIAYGYASDRLLIEREIQNLLLEYNNNQRYYKMWPKVINYQFCGDLNSCEYFFFGTAEVCNAIALFDMLCNSVQIGTSDKVYGINPKNPPVGYGEELRKFYDPGQDEYVPYPTEFKNGYPIYKTREEWDDIPIVQGVI